MHMGQIVMSDSNMWLYALLLLFMLDNLMIILYIVVEYVQMIMFYVVMSMIYRLLLLCAINLIIRLFH